MIDVPVLLNSSASIKQRINAGLISPWKPVLLLFSRLLFFAIFQGLIALLFLIGGNPHPWEASIAWWMVTFCLGNVASIICLNVLAKSEGLNLGDIYRVGQHSFKKELGITLLVLPIIAILAFIPNLVFASLLFPDPNQAVTILFQPLPAAVIYLLIVLIPISVALAELPTYFAYILPRLSALTGKKWLAVLATGFCLALQHIAVPLVFDWRFIAWRFLMFLPFALFLAWLLNKRPQMLPYLMIVHGLLDAQLPFMLFAL